MISLFILFSLIIFNVEATDFLESVFYGSSASSQLGLVESNILNPADCSGKSELHMISFEQGFGSSFGVTVNRKTPVVLVINYNTPLAVLSIKAAENTKIEKVVIISTSRVSPNAIALTNVDQKNVEIIDFFPKTPFSASFELGKTLTTRNIQYAEDYTGLKLTSFHGVHTASSLLLKPAVTEKKCECPDSRIWDAQQSQCVCKFGFSGGDCSTTSFTPVLAATQSSTINDAARQELLVTASLGYGGDMKCLLDGKEYSAYWKTDKTIVCDIDAVSKKPSTGEHTLSIKASSSANAFDVAGKIKVEDGASVCGMKTTCGACQQGCVWCADQAKCLPGTLKFPPNDCYADQSGCAGQTLSVNGAAYRARIAPDVIHVYQFTVSDSQTDSVDINVRAATRSVQENTVASIYLRKDARPDLTSNPKVYDDVFGLDPDKETPKADFTLQKCDLTPGTYYIAVTVGIRYTYDISVDLSCSCPNVMKSTAPVVTSVTPTISPLVRKEGEASPTIDVKGSGFNTDLNRLSCRFDTGSGAYLYSVGKIVSGNVQCDVPSFDELPQASVNDKVPTTAKVQVANDKCTWSEAVVYHAQWTPLLMNTYTGRGLSGGNVIDDEEAAPLLPGQFDLYQSDLSGSGSTIAASFVARKLGSGAGALTLYVLPASALPLLTSGDIQCDANGVKCGKPGELSERDTFRFDACSLDTEVYYVAVKNSGTDALSYGVGLECGCGTDTTGEITAVTPPLSNVEGYDFITITGKDFRPTTVRTCSFGAEGETTAEYLSPTQVRCLTPPQTSANRPSSVALTVNGPNRPVLNSPCAVSAPFTFPYYVQLARTQEYTVKLSETKGSFFLFDFLAGRKRNEGDTMSFNFELKPKDPLAKTFVAVAQDQTPQKPEESELNKQTFQLCHVAADSKWYAGVWADGFEDEVTVKFTEATAECEGQTPSPTPPPATVPGPGPDGQTSSSSMIVLSFIYVLINIALLI
mmetsp:Transcript_21219/g.36171  ORF Transcript_21219/g.36171 Transcript_21219/m.36171 type:complete len:978 (+) Transcript_21219:37-2970(+)